MAVLYCADLKDKPGFPGCCDSCHDDADEGYYELMEHYDGDRLTHLVCCRVSTWLGAQLR